MTAKLTQCKTLNAKYPQNTKRTTKYHRSLLLGAADRGVVNVTLEHTALLGVVSVILHDVTGVD